MEVKGDFDVLTFRALVMEYEDGIMLQNLLSLWDICDSKLIENSSIREILTTKISNMISELHQRILRHQAIRKQL